MAIGDQLEKTFKDPTPFYAVVGAGDLAVQKLREVRAEAQERMVSDVKSLPDKAQAAVSDVVSQAFETYTGLANRGKELFNRVRDEPASQEFAARLDEFDDQVEETVDTGVGAAFQAADAAEDAANRVGETRAP